MVLVLPGLLVASAMRMPLRSALTFAHLPLFSLAFIFVVGEFADLVGFRFGVPPLLAGALIVTLVAMMRRRRPRLACGDERGRDLAMLACAVIIGLGIWATSAHGHAAVPPGVDAAHHGFFTARILDTGSTSVEDVLVSDPAGKHKAVAFYPLAMHAAAAPVVDLFGADVGSVLVAFTVLFAAVVWPLGVFVLALRIFPERRLAAGLAALVCPLLAFFPYSPIQFGDVAVVVGMALVPVAIVALYDIVQLACARSSDEGRSRSAGADLADRVAIAALAVVAVVAVHSSQLALVAIVVVGLVAEAAWNVRSVAVIARILALLLAVGVVGLALMAPTVARAAEGVAERSGFDNTPTRSLSESLRPALALDSGAFVDNQSQILFAALAFAGVAVAVALGRWGFAASFAAVIMVMVWSAFSDDPVGKVLGLAWYHGPSRIGWNRALFVTVFAGLAAESTLRAARAVRAQSWRAVILAASVGVGALAASHGMMNASGLLERSFAEDTIVDGDSKAAFDWLADNVSEDETVAIDVNQLGLSVDNALWMYAYSGVRPLFGWGLPPESTGFTPASAAARRDFAARFRLLRGLDGLGHQPEIDALARRYRTRYVYFDERRIQPFVHTLDLASLDGNESLSPAFVRGPVHVYEVTLPEGSVPAPESTGRP